jgi:hypothetical protein
MTNYNPPATRRRWFQVQLSTVFVLVGIAAWAMAIRPYTIRKTELVFTRQGEPPRVISTFAGHYGDPGSEEWLQTGAGIPQPTPGRYEMAPSNFPNPRLAWPVLALGCFAAWKAGWAIVERRKARSEPTPRP